MDEIKTVETTEVYTENDEVVVDDRNGTVEGFIGGVVLACVAAAGYAVYRFGKSLWIKRKTMKDLEATDRVITSDDFKVSEESETE